MKKLLISSNDNFDLIFLSLDFSRSYPRIRIKVCNKGLLESRRNQHYRIRQEANSSSYHILVYGEKVELSKVVCTMIDTMKLFVKVLREEKE